MVGLTVFAGTAAAGIPAGSLIVNGSFEDPVTTGGFFASIPGWTPSVPCTAQGNPIQVSPFGGEVVDGNQALELNTGCAGNGIQQIVPTEPGTTYTLTYAYSPRPGSLDEDNEMEVWFDGDLVETVGPLTPDAGFDWKLHQIDVTASGTSAVLEFVDVGAGSIQGNDLDFVVLVPKQLDVAPLTPIPGTAGFDDLDCPTATSCVAVGAAPGYTSATVTTFDACVAGEPQVVEDVDFYKVDCMDEDSCVGVGDFPNTGESAIVLIEDGVPGAPITVPGARVFFDVACPTANTCIAVGGDTFANAVYAVVEDGVPGPAQIGGPALDFLGIACNGPTSCLALATDFYSASALVAIEDGVAGTPQPLSAAVDYQKVECTSEHDCVAIGNDFPNDRTEVVVIHDGVAQPPQLVPGTYTYDLACTDTRCTAVGVKFYGAGFVIDIVDGVAGAVQEVTGVTTLQNVGCSADSCIADGYQFLPNFYGFGGVVAIEDGVVGPVQYVENAGDLGPIACSPEGCVVLGLTADYSSGGFVCPAPGAEPTILLDAEDPIYAGGDALATATVAGGNDPTGTVTFSLYGPDDPNCEAPIAVEVADLTGSSANSGPVPVGAAGTYNWVASYDGDLSNAAVATACGATPFEVVPQTLTGRAFGLQANGSSLLGAIHVAPTPDTGEVATTETSTVAPACVANLSGPVSAQNLCASVETTDYPGRSEAVATVGKAGVSLLSIPAVTLEGIEATSTTTCDGSVGTTTIGRLKIGGTTVIGSATAVAPNTGVNVGVVHVVLNEQIPFSAPDEGLTVNAAHITINLGITHLDVVLGSAESDIADCP